MQRVVVSELLRRGRVVGEHVLGIEVGGCHVRIIRQRIRLGNRKIMPPCAAAERRDELGRGSRCSLRAPTATSSSGYCGAKTSIATLFDGNVTRTVFPEIVQLEAGNVGMLTRSD